MTLATGFGLDSFGNAGFGGTLYDGQFDLGGYVFGPGRPVGVHKWETGAPESRNQDQAAGAGDWRVFGRDRLTPGSWSFTLLIEQQTTGAALGMLEELRTAWDLEALRATPGAVAALRYQIAGRVRVVYGRPRPLSAPLDMLALGFVPAIADFTLAEIGSYDDVERSLSLQVGSATSTGGVAFPATFPRLWGTSAGSPSSGTITVGGTRQTWLSARFTPPVVNPYLIVGDRVVQLQGELFSGGRAVTLSAVPWRQGLWHDDGTPAGELTLAPSSRLAQLRVAPGQHVVTFGGVDNTGTAGATVTWRDAYASI